MNHRWIDDKSLPMYWPLGEINQQTYEPLWAPYAVQIIQISDSSYAGYFL